MASISTDRKTGYRKIQFAHPTKGRQTLRLGKVSKKVAENVRIHTERLLVGLHSGQPIDAETARWTATLSDKFHGQLCRVGLLSDRQIAAPAPVKTPTLDEFLVDYIAGRAKLASNTVRNLQQSRRILCEFFGTSRPIHTIIAGDADQYREYLVRNDYATATVSREIKRARQFFEAAKRRQLVDANPFASVRAGSQANAARMFYVCRAAADAAIAACPDDEWKLIVALCRYGGLRCPSELQALCWGDIDWSEENGKVVIRSPKTGTRVIPLWPEIRGPLASAFERAEAGQVQVIVRYRTRNANLRTQFIRILLKAGIKPWPRLFQNMRSSRETELMHFHPIHLVCAWIGNSEAVAKKHYLQVTEEDFREATQNPTHFGAALGCTKLHPENESAVSLAIARDTAVQVPPRGVEPRFSD